MKTVLFILLCFVIGMFITAHNLRQESADHCAELGGQWHEDASGIYCYIDRG